MAKLKAYVINLDTRPDRWQILQQLFRHVDVLELVRFPALTGTPGWKYCALSHQECVRQAKARGEPYVLVLEDDVFLPAVAQFNDFWPRLLAWLTAHPESWEAFTGGPTFWAADHGPTEILNRELGLVAISWGYAAHFMLYSARCYDKILAWDINVHTNEPEDVIDVYIAKHVRLVTAYPYVAIQRPSYSDLRQEFADYQNFFTNAEALVGQFLTEH